MTPALAALMARPDPAFLAGKRAAEFVKARETTLDKQETGY